MRLPNDALIEVLREAYCCPHFGSCKQAKFRPSVGHIPRGFLGASGDLCDVEAIFVVAEPGHPGPSETYPDGASAGQLLQEAVGHTYNCYRNGIDQFHRNMRWVMDQLWPGEFDEQLRRVWITEGRLCSIDREIGAFNDRLCAPLYLRRQLELMPSATVVLFGGKAQHRAAQVSIVSDRLVIGARALAPPGANHKASRVSWANAIDAIVSRRL